MTVKNLNLAIPMELYIALKQDAELVAAPVTTHIRGVLMRYIRSTDEAVQTRKAEATAAARPLGAQQQALAEYQTMVENPFTITSDAEASAWIQRRASLVKLAGNRTDLMRIPNWFGDQAHASLDAFDPANTIDWVLRKSKTAAASKEETPEELEASFMAALKGD
jgi:hypothetical protein